MTQNSLRQFCDFYLTDSLEKVFCTLPPRKFANPSICAIKGEVPGIQFVIHTLENTKNPHEFSLSVKNAPGAVRLRSVENIYSDFPSYDKFDENYLSTEVGVYPDLLRPISEGSPIQILTEYQAVWIDFPDTKMMPAGQYKITLGVQVFETQADTAQITQKPIQESELSFDLEILAQALPAQTLLHTEWLYTDCLSDYYKVPVFGETHFAIIEKFIAMATNEHAVNVMLTPVFTPPLDTEVNGERTTTQLVDISYQDDVYLFDFHKLKRFCEICTKYGIKHLEMPHLFTQWGAKATPKIVVKTQRGEEKLFGWHVPSTSSQYRIFLKAFLPELIHALNDFGYDKEHLLFHLSDEPEPKHLESYRAARNQVVDLLKNCKVYDALSDYSFYKLGLVENPIPSNNSIELFVENQVPDLWVYYCCAQHVDVPNRFFAMPSARNRIMGVLMYIHRIRGFLHWGYNFYLTEFAKSQVDPFTQTSAGKAFPSGDPFLVYPGKDGTPLSSIRAEVHRAAMDDVRALQLLEIKIGRQSVLALIHDVSGMDSITFKTYPKEASFLHQLHEAICLKLKETSIL